MALEKEIWLPEFLDHFRANGEWLNPIPDRSSAAKNKVIHLREIGADPVTTIDGAGPWAASARTDVDQTFTLHRYDSTTTAISAEVVRFAPIDIIRQTAAQHSQSILEKAIDRAAWYFGPDADAANSPIRLTTGAAEGGRLKMTVADLLAIKQSLDEAKAPQAGRVLVLCPKHFRHLMEADTTLFKMLTNITAGEPVNIFGFQVYTSPFTPVYDAAEEKKAYGSAAAPLTDRSASFVYHVNTAFKATDAEEMFENLAKNDPVNRANTVGFRLYHLAQPIPSATKFTTAAIVDDME